MKKRILAIVFVLPLICSGVAGGLYPPHNLPFFAFGDNQMKEEINNSLDCMMKNSQDYLSNPMLLSLWVMSKAFLDRFDNSTDVITYFDSRQESDGSWVDNWTPMFTTHRALLAYFVLNAHPARSLDVFLSNYDTWNEVQQYYTTTGSGDLRNVYHIFFAWVTYYHVYPLWMNDFFNAAESDLSWTYGSDFHRRTHILYSYVVARRPLPNLDAMINATLAGQESDGHWAGSQYSFGSPVYFTSLQITLLNQISKLYPGHRTNEITASLEKAKAWTNSSYHTTVLDGKICGYFGDKVDLENAIFAGTLCASQTGLVSANVDMTFQSLVDNLAQAAASFEYSPEKPIVNEQIDFNASASYSTGGNITSYEWNFDDDNTTEVTVPMIDHAYALPGNYTVTLRVTDDKDLWNTTTKTITVYLERVYTFNVSWQGIDYAIVVVSNSTVKNFNFNYSLKQISLNVTGLLGTMGCCNVSIPKTFMWCDSPSQWNVTVDGSPVNDLKVTEDTNTSLFFTYGHSTHEVVIRAVNIVPEFPSASILLLFMIIVLIGVVFAKKRPPRDQEGGKIV